MNLKESLKAGQSKLKKMTTLQEIVTQADPGPCIRCGAVPCGRARVQP